MTMQSAIFYITKIVDSATLFIQYIMWIGIYQSNFKNDIRLIILENIVKIGNDHLLILIWCLN